MLTKSKKLLVRDLARGGKLETKLPKGKLLKGAAGLEAVSAVTSLVSNTLTYSGCLKKAQSDLDSCLEGCMGLCSHKERQKCISNCSHIHTLSASICATEFAIKGLENLIPSPTSLASFFGVDEVIHDLS